MANRNQTARNDYRCSIERNQAGKYCVRIRVRYARHAFTCLELGTATGMNSSGASLGVWQTRRSPHVNTHVRGAARIADRRRL